MKPIERMILADELAKFEGKTAYVHLEANPGVFLRNIPVDIAHTFAAGDDPFRAAVQSTDGGWIRAEGLTHMDSERFGRLLLAGHDTLGRITAALQLSLTPFDFEREESTK